MCVVSPKEWGRVKIMVEGMGKNRGNGERVKIMVEGMGKNRGNGERVKFFRSILSWSIHNYNNSGGDEYKLFLGWHMIDQNHV